jgi:putative hydrolase
MLELPEQIRNDLHVHSFRSRCGQHDYFVLYEHAGRLGLESIAVTDHGLDLGGMAVPSTFLDYKRTPAFLEGVRVYRGIEANLRSNGTTDAQDKYEKDLDIILLGLHSTKSNDRDFQYLPPKDLSLLLPDSQPEAYYTGLLLKAVSECSVDAITHPNNRKFPLCMDAVAEACKEKGIAIELNNSIFLLGKDNPEKTKEMIDAVNKYAPRIIAVSDAHCYMEIGQIGAVKRILGQHPIEADVELVNAALESTEAFVKERKGLRRVS